jgi:DNA (cytosine-5)-methyltransferase 1
MEVQSNPTFIDLFAGIGGMRIAFEKAGAKCVFSSEWDKFAAETYNLNFGEEPKGDITKTKSEEIPAHNILVAGFPCQPFSLSGVSKKNSLGVPHGFNDAKQGNLFFDIARILDHHKPDAFLLENVKNLKGHDKGKTFRIIMQTLMDNLNYNVSYKILDAVNYVPQHRQRIYIVGFKKRIEFKYPVYKPNTKPAVKDILEKKVDKSFTLTNHLWNYLQNYAEKHRIKGNGFGFGLVSLNSHSRTLSARYHKDGSEILIPQNGKNPRKLTPRECANLMGFPSDFKIEVSNTQAYRQFGNSVVVPIVTDIAKSIVGKLTNKVLFNENELLNYNFEEGETYEQSLFRYDEIVSVA